MSSWSLRLRLTLLVGLLTLGTILLFALTFYIVLEANLLNQIDSQLRERAALVANTLSTTGASGEAAIPAPPLLAEFDVPGIYVQLVGPDGRALATSSNLGGVLPTDPTLLAAAQQGQSATSTMAAGGDEQLRLFATPVVVNGNPSTLIVAESLEPLKRTLYQARALLTLCGGIALALALVGAALLTGHALAPIARLTRAAALVSTTGQYDQRVPVSVRRDEVGLLTATINDLIATVDRTIKQQRQFLADTSHELRSPLTVILGNLNLLRRELPPDERNLCVDEATAEAQRMRRLIGDLLMLAQADTAQVITRAPVQLDRLVEMAIAVAVRQAPDYTFRAQIEAPATVLGDQERLTQVLRNLLENASHHTPPGTEVWVRLRRTDSVAQIIVADNGPGVAVEHVPHLFERFYRVDKARERSSGSTGLGLAIVKYLVEAHGGSVSVSSDEGRGTTFTILLPLAESQAG